MSGAKGRTRSARWLIGLVLLAQAPAWGGPAAAAGGKRGLQLLPPVRPRPLVLVLRRPGLRSYERVIEEFRGKVGAEVRVLSARPAQRRERAAGELRRWLERTRPNLVFAVGQSAYDFAREAAAPLRTAGPLLHVWVYHDRPGGQDRVEHGIASQPPAAPLMRALALARPGVAGGRVLALHSRRTAAAVADARRAAREQGIELEALVASDAAAAIGQLRRALAPSPGRRGPAGIWLVPDPLLLTPQVFQYAVRLQFRRRVPLMGATRQHVSQGALLAVDLDPSSLGQQAAGVANALLQRGSAERSPSTPRRRRQAEEALQRLLGQQQVRLSVNAVTARRLGVSLRRLLPMSPEVLR